MSIIILIISLFCERKENTKDINAFKLKKGSDFNILITESLLGT